MQRRFVIQNHKTRSGAHYDLMLEAGAALATWRIDRLPTDLRAGEALPARALPDHRLAYLSCEGEISGGRGRVRIAAGGTYRLLARLAGDRWQLRAVTPEDLRNAGSAPPR